MSPLSPNKAVQFIDGLGGNDEFALAGFRNIHFLIDQRQAAAIGRHQRHFVLLEADENSVENVPGFVVEMAKEVLRNMP
jgi:hypothetical protein